MPNNTRKGLSLFDGRAGESLFTSPNLASHLVLSRYNQVLPGFVGKIQATGDDRSLAVTSAVVVEHFVDELLRAWIPGSRDLTKDDAALTFSEKISLARACRLVPPHLLRCADMVRRVRNAFAHDLEIDSFDQVPSREAAKIRSLWHEIYDPYETATEGGGAGGTEASLSKQFRDLAMVASAGLQSYVHSVERLRREIQSREFMAGFLQREQAAHDAEMAALEGGRVRVEMPDGTVMEYFVGGLTRATPAPDPSPPAEGSL